MIWKIKTYSSANFDGLLQDQAHRQDWTILIFGSQTNFNLIIEKGRTISRSVTFALLVVSNIWELIR